MKKLLFSVIITAIALAAVGILAVSGQEADPPCVVAILNRTAFVQPDGSWIIDNIPSNMGLVRARMTCIRGRTTVSGQSDFFEIIPNVITQLDAPIELGVVDPIPESIEVTAPTTTLTTSNLTVQLTVTATYSDGSTSDITLREEGTNYTSSNTNIATVSENGLVTAISSGTVLITASNEQVFASIRIQVILAADLDGDGLPDDFELANGMNPNDPVDALEDFDDDGLTNLQEFQEGTAIRDADTDDDTIPDGEELAVGDDGFVTNPLLADTDGDQIRDALEIETGTDPTDPNSRNFRAALTGIDVKPDSVTLIVNNVFIDETTAQLLVTGFLRDGTTADLTSRSTGTKYLSSDLLVVNFGTTDGKIFAGRDGTAIVTVTNSGFSDTVPVTVSSFTPTALARLDLPTSGFANNIDVVDDIAYIAHGAAGLLVVELGNRQSPSIIGSVDTPGNANDVRVLGNLAYVADGDAGLQVIDVTDPANPVIVGSVDTPGVAWDVAPAAGGDFAYVADGAAGLQVVNVSDPANPAIVGSVDTPGTAKGVAIDGTLAVIADGSSGVQVIDVSDPEDPDIEGSATVGGDARDVEARGRIAYVAVAASNGFRTVDFTIPTNPVHVGTQNTGGDMLQDVAVAGRFGFGADFLRANGVPVVDVDNPANVRLLFVMDFNTPFTDADGNGVDADENFLYLVGSKGITENGTTGTSMLFIGQYLSLQDPYGIPPTVTITSPPDGGTVFERGFAFITAEAEDDVLVTSVTFFLDGQPVYTDFGEPFVFPFLVPEGSTQFTIGATAADLAGNTGVAEDIVVNVESPAQRIVSVAQRGTPANPGLPSANPGQTIRLESDSVGAFNINTMVTFPTINDSGVTGTTAVKVASASPDGTLATVAVPAAANTGGVTVSGLEANFALQIVPRLDSFSNADFRPGANLQLNGAGFIEGDIRVNFGAVQVADPDTGTGTINVFNTNSALSVSIPASAGGMVSVTTAGGTSNALSVGPGSFTGIIATATFGTPADPDLPSANIGQVITVTGTDLKPNTNVIFQTIDDNGTLGTVGVRIGNISADKTSATVTVPSQVMTGTMTMLGAPGAFPLQIVPRLTSFSNGDYRYSAHSRDLRLDGSGFIEGGTTVDFGTSAIVDPDTTANMMDIFSSGGSLNTAIPLRPGPVVQVITEGGTSNPLTVGPTSFTGVQATASVGTPADPAVASANVGQTITITGTGFNSNTNVRFPVRGDEGQIDTQSVGISGFNSDGTLATVVVPTAAVTGSLAVPGTEPEPPAPDTTGMTLAYSNDFETAAGPEWSSQTRTTTTGSDVATTTYLGRFSNDMVVLTLRGLPSHSKVVIAWDLFLLDSWDGVGGCCGPDFWGFNVAGQAGPEVETFFSGGAFSPPLLTERTPDVLGEFGPINTWQDRLYRGFVHGFWHSGDTLQIAFYGRNLQGVADESWGLDNIRVYIDSSPDSVGTPLQIVPRLSSFENNEYRPGVNLRLLGSGFVEGASTVAFGGVSITDPDTGTGTINVWSTNTVLDVGIPRLGGPTVTVTTSGGTSNALTPGPTSFTGIQATASFGTPADPAVASANVGQTITITGTDLKSNTMVFFPSADEDEGVVTGFWAPVSSVGADGTWATVVVPTGAATGELMLGGLEPPPNIPSTEGLTQVFSADFEAGAGAEWSVSTTSTNPATTTYLGRFANNTVTLALSGLPAHSSIVLEWDLLIIDSWDGAFGGCCSPDIWGFNVAGRPSPEYRYAFPSDSSPESFYRGPDVSRDDFGVLGGWPDRIYRNITHAFNHSDSSLQMSFFGANLEGVNNESWGLDNVRVYVSAATVAEPATDPARVLQVVPRLTSFSNSSFAPSGTSRTLQLNGGGFVEGGTTVNFGSVAVVDPDGSVNTVDVFSSSQALSTVIPSSPGPVVSVTTAGGTSNSLTVGPTSFTAIQATASSGTPADSGQPSANIGQTITLIGTDLKANTTVFFPTVSDAGAASTQAVSVDSVAVDGTWATAVVPTAAVTGSVTMSGVGSSLVLQVVPRLTSFSNSSFAPSGTSRTLQLNGSGFVEGGTTVNFGSVAVVDPDTSSNTLDVFSTNTSLNVIIPTNASGLVSVTTAGGTSAALAVGPSAFTGIQAAAQFGTPADAGQPSANADQTITVTGSTFKSNMRVVFPTVDDNGTAGTVAVAPTSIAIDESWATVTVPQSAVTGVVTIPGTTGSFTLQIVPHITSSNFAPLTAGTVLRLNGSGFIEGRGTRVNFGPVSVTDPDSGTATMNILNTNTALDVTVPAGAQQNVTVTTAGGTSITLNLLAPNIAIESPGNGDPVPEEAIITVRARALDNVSVQSVEFLVNGEAPSAFSGQVTSVAVDGVDNIFGAGKSSAPGGGQLPPGITLPAQPGQVVKVLGVSGRVSGWAAGCAFNPADGARVCGSSTNVASSGGISGLIHNNRTMFLAGVFLDNTTPADPAPARLDVSGANSQATIAPQLRQTFFMGDGRTDTGGLQEFVVPAGATRLFLGFVENCGFNTGAGPNCYSDNGGTLTVSLAISDTFPATFFVAEPVAAGSTVDARLFVTTPAFDPSGSNTLTIEASATDGDGNTTDAAPVVLNVVEPTFSLSATAQAGTPASPGSPSANVGQLVTLTSNLKVFSSQTIVSFPTINDSGAQGTLDVLVAGASADGVTATVSVPGTAITGVVTVENIGASSLQVVPRLTSFDSNSDFVVGQFIRFFGSGFVEGGTTVMFGPVPVVDPNTSTGTIDVWQSNTALNLNGGIPADAGSTITVVTAGGTSAPFVMGPTAFTAIQAAASSGTPADPGQPSANAGQLITLTGADFRSNTNVAFATINENNGTTGVVYARISGLSADRTTATVVVPSTAITGQVSLFGAAGSLPLQVVPRLTGFESNSDFRPGEFLRLIGSGFVEGNSTVQFGDVAVTDPDAGTNVINVWNSHTRLDLNIPANAGSTITVVTAGGTSAPFVMGPTAFTAIQATASSGTPASAGQPSANVGQLITLVGANFRSNTNVYFSTMNDSGIPGTVPVRVVSLAADRTWATVVVPSGAVTGDISVFGTTGAFRLQVVPRLTGFSNSAFLPSGTSRNMQLFGNGFIEGETTVHYGDTPVVDPDAGFETLDVFSTGTSLSVIIPENPGPVITVQTSGGTSTPLTVGPTSFTSIQATAATGTPADPGQPSANAGQLITVVGSGFRSNTYLTFPTLSDNGVPGFQSVQVSSVNADGTSATFTVPNGAVTGSVSMTGTGVALPLQVVPHISSFSMTSFTPGTNLRLNGGGFMEGATTVNFGPVAVVDPDTSWPTLDVFSNNTAMNVTIPSGGDPTVTVVTAGGTSNTVALLEDTFGAASTPDVTITSPAIADTVFRRGALLITADASDDIFLKSVTFTLKDQALEEILSFTDLQAPYEFLYFVPEDSPAQLVIAATALDLAGNVGEAQEIIVNVADSDASITATATVGTPADPSLPSANVGQAITLNGAAGAFSSTTTVTFPTSADNGTKGTAQVTVNSVAPDGSSATVVVPASAATGGLVISGVVGNFALQVVPTITSFSNNDFRPGANLRLDGSGFIEGGSTVNFGVVSVVDPSTSSATVDVFFTNSSMNVTIPGDPGSEVSVTTAGGTSNSVLVGPESFTGLEGVAAFGTPANAGLPSANVGQAVTIRGTGLKANTNVTFTTRDDNGVVGSRSVRVSSASANGTFASVVVPSDAVTGSVTMPGVTGSFTLQVVPRLTSFLNSNFAPSGTSRSLQLNGSGFVEGGTTVSFGPVSVVDPDISFNTLDVFSTNTGLNVVIPVGARSSVTVITAGGTSNVLTVGPGSFTGIQAMAAMGTPANPALPSANAGQAITVLGTDLKANTNLVFPTRDDNGLLGSVSVRVSSVSADNTSATVVVPLAAITGNVTMSGVDGSFALQVVPRLNSFANDDFRPGITLRLEGSGFLEGATTVNFGATSVVDPNIGSGTVDVFWTNTGLNVVIPTGAGGVVSVTTSGGTSNTLAVGPTSFSGIQAVASLGTPANPALPSANPGQTILVSGTGLKANTNLVFQAVDDSGSTYTQAARVSSVAIDGTWATVVVPQAATTGDVTMPGTTGSFRLQVVPVISSFSNDDFRPSGASRSLQLNGGGFVEGGSTVSFGAVQVVDPSISADTLDVFWTNTGLNVVIPAGAGGMVSVTTAGGTSNTLSVGPTSFSGIQAVASLGTPADPAQPSANPGQTILVTGTGLKPNTNLVFQAVGDDGSTYTQAARVSSVAIDGTWATVVVPQAATTGDVTMPGTTGSFRLQVVPVISSFSNDDFRPSGGNRSLQLNGSGFVEGGTTVSFGAVQVVDPSISADTLDVFWTNTGLNVVIPAGAGGVVSVTTAGGTSNTLAVGPTSFSGIQAVASLGTPADPAQPSANPGQTILVTGTGLKPNTNLLFPAVDDSGSQYDRYVRVSSASPDGTEATVVVPHGARRGMVSLFGTGTSFELQVVTTITSFSYSSFTQGANLRLTGSGYVESDTVVNFGSTSVVDPDASHVLLDVFWDGTNLNVTIPFGAGQDVTVTTDGGTSNSAHMSLPTVFIAAPMDGTEVASEAVVSVTAVAMDNTGIQSVEFLVDGVVAFTDITAPYQFAFTTPAFDPGGDNTVTLGARATDLDSNVATAAEVDITVVAPTFAINSVAEFGTPKNAGEASANVGQTIVLEASYPAFTTSTQVTFSIMNDAGPASTRNVQVSNVFDGGRKAGVVVPADAVTGTLSVTGVGSGTLQIVPRLTGFESNSDFRTGEFLRLVGSGFIEGDSTVRFGSVAVVDPDTGSNVINIWNTNTRLDLSIPDGAGSTITVETSGGTSAPFVMGPTSFTGIEAVASSGTPADPGVSSANAGQAIKVTGSGFRSNTNVTFQVANDSGGAGRQSVRVSSVNIDGTEATVVVPTAAATGLVTLQGLPLDNLLQNGGNEQALVAGEIPGWTEVTGTNWTRRTSNPAPFDGGAYFFAGAVPSAELRQDVDVSAFADAIAAGTQSFAFEGFVRSFNQTPADTARIVVEYRDASNSTVLESFDSGEIASRTAWVRVADTRVAPTGTGFIRVRLISTRFAGDNNDGYFDALSLRPVTGTEPAFQLQIVPRVTGFEFNNDFSPGQFLRLVGSGFIEGDVSVRFGTVEVIDPDEGGGTINIWNTNTRLDLNIPSGAGSAVTVVTDGGTSAPFFVGPQTLTGIQATAQFGTPADPGVPSANVGQLINLTGTGLTYNTNVVFTSVNEGNGTVGVVYARVAGVSIDGTAATVVVPNGANTGPVSLFGAAGSLPLQVVPRLTSFESNSDFRPGEFLRLIGSGFVEGDVVVNFGSVAVTDPDAGTNVINVWNSHTRLDLFIPTGAGSPVTVVTDGGTSEPLFIAPTAFTAVEAQASVGTPADSGLPSANVGQVITVIGSGFRSNTNVIFPTVNDSGVASVAYVRVAGINADGTEATVVVPNTAVTGGLSVPGIATTSTLQVVPQISSYSLSASGNSTILRLNGGGFVEGATTVNIGGMAVVDPGTDAATLDVFSSGTSLDVVMPNAGGEVNVVTAGGTSNSVTVGINIPAGQQDLSLLPGTTATASTIFSASYTPPMAIDGILATSWFTANNDPAPSFTVTFNQDVTVHSLQVIPNSRWPTGFNFFTGQFTLYDAADTELYSTGVVSSSVGNFNVAVTPAVSNVRKVVFEGFSWESVEPGFGELAVVGTAP